MDQGEYKYWAFISYSHRDKAWGDWLHKTLETFRTPVRLAGRPSRDGAVPKRLYPVFRDRDELPSSASLSENIDTALRQSRYLIVICSPRAAVSRWVDGEIRQFKKLGREDRVLALVVDGEPNASDRPESGELECFPPSLRFSVDAHGELTPRRAEPIAADARAEGDGKANARLKILAGLLGVGYDELKQREKQRQFWRRMQTAAAAVALLAVLAGGWMWVNQQRSREALVAQYTEQGRQLFTDGKPLQAAVYLSEAYRLGGRGSALRFLLARSMRYVDALKATLPVPGIYLSADLSEDGRRLVTASGAATADVWDGASGRHVATLKGTGSMLVGAHVSPDGSHAIGASKPETMSRGVSLHMWDTGQGKLLYSLPFPDSFLVVGVFDKTGKRFLTRDARHQLVQVWDTATGKELFRLPATPGSFEHAAFSPDGRYIVTAQKDFSVHVFDGADGHAEHVLRGHTGEVKDFEFSGDGRLMATASADKSVQVWELATGKRLTRIARKNADDYDGGHEDEVNAAAFTRDGKRLITASKDKTARVWDVATGKLVDDLARLDEEVGGISISRDGRYATVNGNDSTLWLYDLADYTLRATLKATGAAFLPDGKTLLTFDTQNAAVQSWDLATLAANQSVPGDLPVFSPDESRMLTVHYDVVNIRDGDGKLLKEIQLPPDPKHPEDKTFAEGVVWSPDGKRFAVEDADPAYVSGLWDANGRALGLLNQGLHHVEMPAFTPDSRYVYTCGEDVDWKPAKGDEDSRTHGRLGQLWDAASLKLLRTFPMPDGCVTAPRFDAAGTRMLGTVREDRNQSELYYHAELWDLAAGRRIAKLPGTLDSYDNSVAVSPTPGEVLTATQDGIVHVWDAATGAEKRHWDTHGSGVESLLYSPDGKTIATGHRDGSVKIWDVASGAQRWQMKAQQLGFNTMVYSPDGALMALNGYRMAPRILDAADGAFLMELPGDAHLVDGLGFSPRGDRVSTYAADAENSRVWDMRLEQREPAAVSTLVHCRVPWTLQAGQLVPATASCTR